jgi:exosortase
MTTGVATSHEQPRTAATSFSAALLIKSAILVALVYVLYWTVLVDMAKDWWNYDAYSQGMLLPPLALYIAWLSRNRTFAYPAIPDGRGVLVTAGVCVSYILGSVAAEYFITRMSLVILIGALIWTFWGLSRLRTLAFPMLLLATMVPLPSIVYNSLAAPLQLFASDIAAQIAHAFNVSVYRDGNILQLANVTLGVAEACSGLNSLSALIVGSVLLGYLVCTGLASRLLLLLSSVPLAIAVNVLRVAGTAVLADINEEFAMGFYHSFSGWLVFVCGFGLLYLCARLFHAILDRS